MSKDRERKMGKTMPANGDQWTMAGKGGKRQKLVFAPKSLTLTKFH